MRVRKAKSLGRTRWSGYRNEVYMKRNFFALFSPRVFFATKLVFFTFLLIVNSNAATINVPSGASLQAALNAAQPGDEIVLEAGATYVGAFTLPVKPGMAFITIRSSNMNGLPVVGTRVAPADAVAMPKIVSPGFGEPALRTAPGAHHFQFVGIEFKPINSQAFIYDLVRLGDDGSEQNSLEEIPHHLIIDRCYIHAEPTQSLKRGIALNSAETKIINSYISDFKAVDQDAQAICGWNGPGPFQIINNYLEGSGNNVLFGGASPSVPNLIPSDIEFRRNLVAKPLQWRGVWQVKNLFELKNARRITIDGNVFENNWAHAQSGFAILFTVGNDGDTSPWNAVEDVVFTNNIVRHSGSAFNLLGRDNSHSSSGAARILIRNNFLSDINRQTWGGDGAFIQISETKNVVVDHNTVLHNGTIVNAYGPVSPSFVFTNNLLSHNSYGVFGDSIGLGTNALNAYFPGYVFQKNLIAAAPVSIYPTNNFYPANLNDAQFVNQTIENYRLAASSPYRNAGTDSKDVGCNFDQISAALDETNQPLIWTLVRNLRDKTRLLAASNNLSRAEIQSLINDIQQIRQMLEEADSPNSSQTFDFLSNALSAASKAIRFKGSLARKYMAIAAQNLETLVSMEQL